MIVLVWELAGLPCEHAEVVRPTAATLASRIGLITVRFIVESLQVFWR